MPTNLITLAEAATLLGITERSAYEMARVGKLAGAIKVSGTWRVNPVKLLKWIDLNSVDAEAVSVNRGEDNNDRT